MADFWIYASLFFAAFLAATILPAQSELGLAGLLVSSNYNTIVLIAVASIGNTLGAAINWCLGCGIGHFKNNKWFPASPTPGTLCGGCCFSLAKAASVPAGGRKSGET